MSSSERKEIHAAIGVWQRGDKTFYVLRSQKMENYPGVWGLLSLQHVPVFLKNPKNLMRAMMILQQMSNERLHGALVHMRRFLYRGSSDQNPMGCMVHLNLYEIEFDDQPELQRDFYTDSAWMTPSELRAANIGKQSGLCTKLWLEYLAEQAEYT